MSATADGIDTADMVAWHRALDRALADAPRQLESLTEGDVAAASWLAAYLDEVLWLVQVHHEGEDALLYPILGERAPEAAALVTRMDDEHHVIAGGVEAARVAAAQFAETAETFDGAVLSHLIGALRANLGAHVQTEEAEVLPIAARVMTEEEWGAQPGHALGHYRGERIWLPLGLVLEAMDPEMLAATLAKLPPPVRAMWEGVGAESFAAEMAAIRVT